MHWFLKAFMTLWFGLALLLTAAAVLQSFSTPGRNWHDPLFGLLAAATFVQFGKWLARNDIAWLSDVIDSALCSGAPVRPNKSYLDSSTQGANRD
jgi:hypothetical protein